MIPSFHFSDTLLDSPGPVRRRAVRVFPHSRRMLRSLALGLLLCLFSSACSKDWDWETYELDPLRELSLCVAHLDKDGGLHLNLDNGEVLQPEKKQSFDLTDGGRYKVHYAIRSYDRDEIVAHVFEIFPIDLLPCVNGEMPSGKGLNTPVSIERLWSAGSFLNVSFACSCEGSDNQGHALKYHLMEKNDGSLLLMLEHHCLKAGEKSQSHTLSTPLDSISKGISHLRVNVLENSNNNEVVNTYTLF